MKEDPTNASILAGLGGASAPSKSERDALVYAYAVMRAAARTADFRVQQKTYDKYNRLHSRLSSKYPHVDLSSEDYDRLIARAADSVVVRGPGKEW